MIDVAENPRAVVGGNSPPEPTPYEALKMHIDDLFETAQGFLDGEPIATQGQADAVSKLIDEARKARTSAEAQRKAEAKPFDDGKAAVQALWTPLTHEEKGRCALIVATAKKALTPFLERKEAEQRAAAEALRQQAEEAARKAREAHQASNSDLAAAGNALALETAAEELTKAANRAEKSKAHATGGERAIGLRSRWDVELTEPRAALRHYLAAQPDDLKQWLLEQAHADVRAGKRQIDGFKITERRAA